MFVCSLCSVIGNALHLYYLIQPQKWPYQTFKKKQVGYIDTTKMEPNKITEYLKGGALGN